MSNFKGWTSEALADREQAQLSKRLDAQTTGQAYEPKNKNLPSYPGTMPPPPPKKKGKNPKAKGETANSITANVIRCINIQPKCVAYRINNVGIWDEAKQIHRRANTQKGIFDVSATIRGRTAWFEIKANRDKPSQDQLIFQQEVRHAGGIAEFVTSTDAFLELFKNILLEI